MKGRKKTESALWVFNQINRPDFRNASDIVVKHTEVHLSYLEKHRDLVQGKNFRTYSDDNSLRIHDMKTPVSFSLTFRPFLLFPLAPQIQGQLT